MYRNEDEYWRVYKPVATHTRTLQFARTNQVIHQKPNHASQFANSYRQRLYHVAESVNLPLTVNKESDVLNRDPYRGEFESILDAFNASVASPQILIHDFDLPKDDCHNIALAIKSGTAQAITVRSYKDRAATAAIMITAGESMENVFTAAT